MVKYNGNRGRINCKTNLYVAPTTINALEKQIEGIANYQIQNCSKPTKSSFYDNGIGLIPENRLQLLNIIKRENQIPILIGGINDKAMLTIVTPHDGKNEQTYLKLIELYQNDFELEKKLRNEKKHHLQNLYEKTGIMPEINGPYNSLSLDLIVPGFQLRETPKGLIGKIISKNSPLMNFDINIETNDLELNQIILEDLSEINLKYLKNRAA